MNRRDIIKSGGAMLAAIGASAVAIPPARKNVPAIWEPPVLTITPPANTRIHAFDSEEFLERVRLAVRMAMVP